MLFDVFEHSLPQHRLEDERRGRRTLCTESPISIANLRRYLERRTRPCKSQTRVAGVKNQLLGSYIPVIDIPSSFMASQHASRRSRKLRRRVSSALTGWPHGSPKSAPSPIGRRTSLSPVRRNVNHGYQRLHLTDGSDCEDYQEISTQSLRGRSTSPTRSIFQNRPPPTAYASLPPTPIEPSRPFSPPTPVSPISPVFQDTSSVQLEHEPFDAPFWLWDYLREELLATDFDSHQELKWERVSNFLSIPLAMEQVRRYFPCFGPKAKFLA